MADLRTLIDELQSNNQELLEQNEHLSNLSFEQKETNFNLSLIDDQLSMSNDIGITNQEIQLDSAAIAQDSIVSSASKKEAAADAGKGMTASFKKYLGAGSFLGKGFGKLGDKIGGLIPGGGVKGILGTIGTVAIMGVLVKFLQSDLWKDLKEKWIPVLADGLSNLWQFTKDFGNSLIDFYKTYLLPVQDIFVTLFIKTWENIKTLFTDLSETFSNFGTDGFWLTIFNVFKDIGAAVGRSIDNAITAVYNIISRIFGLEETDSVFGSIKGFFNNIYDTVTTWVGDTFTAVKDAITGAFTFVASGLTSGVDFVTNLVSGVFKSVKKFFTDAFDFASEGISNTWTGISDFIKTHVFDPVITFLTDLFTWPETPAGFATKLIDIVLLPYNIAIGFLESIFGFNLSSDGEKFTLGKFIVGIVSDVVKFFKDMLSFDISKLTEKIPKIPDFGSMFMDVIRRIIEPIINFTMPGLFGYGDTQPLRYALGKMGATGAGLLDFVDQTGSFAAPPPARPASDYSQMNMGEAGRGGSAPIIIQQTNSSVKGPTQLMLNRRIEEADAFMRQATAAF